MKRVIVAIVALFSVFSLLAQDTNWVQTFTFDDITKRRGQYEFPSKEDGPFRKILMYKTLKCDRRTTRDQYPCGEWDYLTYTFLYDHDATYDSTAQTGVNFNVSGSTPDTFEYLKSPLYDKYLYEQKRTVRKDTIRFMSYAISDDGDNDTLELLDFSKEKAYSQVFISMAELKSAGLLAGDISGISFFSHSAGSVSELKIAIYEVDLDSLSMQDRVPNDSFKIVFKDSVSLINGRSSFQFHENFNWSGSKGIVMAFSSDAKGEHASGRLTVSSFLQEKNRGYTAAGDGAYMQFTGNRGAFVDIDKAVQIDGNEKRTIEVWAKAQSFNNGGLFQAGNTGSTLKDWSLRTKSGDNTWRIQLWGADGDATLDGTKDKWHHYALVYDGTFTKFYHNGEFVRQKMETLNTPDRNLWLARWAGNYFHGQIEEVRVWNAALGPKRIKEWMHRNYTNEHPNHAKLVARYNFNDEGTSYLHETENGTEVKRGRINGDAHFAKMEPHQMRSFYQNHKQLPLFTFEQGEFISEITTSVETLEVAKMPVLLNLYENEAENRIYRANETNHPAELTNTIEVWEGNMWTFTYGVDGEKVDSSFSAYDERLLREDKSWFSPDVRYEIGRFITPYGINLSLGPKGFTWVYDVTEYAGLLMDSVDLSSGNQQELLDLRFAFIKGEPAYEVEKVDQVYNHGRYTYRDLDNDTRMKETEIALESEAKNFVLRTRFTGHGHHSDDGEFPHCCEWKDNTHYLMVNGSEFTNWKIWRDDCDLNPVYPQGGTWTGAREGWCPGDLVEDYDFDITKAVSGNSVKIDYDITPVPSDNKGMGNGNYRADVQLFQLSEFTHTTDAELEKIKRPTTDEYYSRINPACEGPIVTVRNLGAETITQMNIEYAVSGGTSLTYEWNGEIKSFGRKDILLPLESSHFWVGDGNNVFTASIKEVNGAADDYSDNDVNSSSFNLPEIIENKFFIQLRTNNFPAENRYEIRDEQGNVVFSKDNLSANTIYRDTINLKPGCYAFELFDEGYGLSYWAAPSHGNGTIQIRSERGGLVKNFNPDFGGKVYWSFAVSSISNLKEIQETKYFEIFPNPTTNNFTVNLNGWNGLVKIDLINAQGKVLESRQLQSNGLNNISFNTERESGLYFVKVRRGGKVQSQKLVITK